MAEAQVSSQSLTPYKLSFVVGGLLADRAEIVANVYLNLHDWKATQAELIAGNLLRCRTQSSSGRTGRELIQRMQTLDGDEIAYLVTAPSPDRLHLMWAAMCRRYEFVAEFASEVLRDQVVLGATTLTTEDFERFWSAKALWHPELDEVKSSTARKLCTNLFLAMREAGFITAGNVIVPPLLSSTVVKFLDKRTPSEIRWFPVTNRTHLSGGQS